MNWRNALRPASFRGCRFEVEAGSLSGGRRVQVHEYPQRDNPFTEDMGRSKREYSVSAFLIGPMARQQRDALLNALEEAGPGTLVHPFHGELRVAVQTFDCSWSKDEGGIFRVEMSFVEAGELTFPSSIMDSVAALVAAANTLQAIARGDFAALFGVLGLSGSVFDSALSAVGTVLDVLDRLGGVGSALLGMFRSDLSGFLHDPVKLAAELGGLIGEITDLSTLEQLAGADFGMTTGKTVTAAGQQRAINADSLSTLVHLEAIAQAMRVVGGQSWEIYDDAVTVRDALSSRMDAEMNVTQNDAVFSALREARVTLIADINRRAETMSRLQKVTLPETVPALVLSYDLYGTASRSGEIVARNRVRHPGFLPPSSLLVGSS